MESRTQGRRRDYLFRWQTRVLAGTSSFSSSRNADRRDGPGRSRYVTNFGITVSDLPLASIAGVCNPIALGDSAGDVIWSDIQSSRSRDDRAHWRRSTTAQSPP